MNIIAELTKIKNFIVTQVSAVEKDSVFINELDSYLIRLINDVEGKILKDDIQTKAGRQLLCCIGIDLKNDLVPLSHYLKIFKHIPFYKTTLQAKDLFFNCINDNHFYFRETMIKIMPEFCVFIFPIKDRDYYIDAYVTGIHSIATIEFMVEELVE